MSEKWHDALAGQIARRGDAFAMSDTSGLCWTYADLDAAIEDVRARLVSAGVKPGDRVMVLAENGCSAVAALFAATRAGAIAVPVNARQTQAEVDRVIAHAAPRVVLATSGVSPDAQAHAERLGGALVEGRFGQLHFHVAGPNDPYADPDIAVLLYTTGTTGTPKGVMLTHGNLLFGGRTSSKLRGMNEADLIYGVLPLTHVFGLTSILTAAAIVGAGIRFAPRFAPAALYEALNDGVTLLSAVPQMHALLMQYLKEQGLSRLPQNALRYVSSGAAPLDPEWKRKAEAFYGIALQNGWGMTETSAGVCITISELGDPDTSVGPPLPGNEVILDENVPGGGDGMGEVLVRGPNVMKGYFRNPAATAEVLSADGWLHTGDLGRIDEKGRVHILGRSKELIIHGGFNVYPPEVEAALNEHPQVVQCAVVGRVVKGDEKVMAFVQAAADDMPDPEVLRAFAAERLAGYKRPSQIIVATDLPAAATGKILKHRLLEHFADQLA